MNPILRNLIVETLVVILLGILLAARIAPAEIAFPSVIIVGIAAIFNAIILVVGPSTGEGVVRRTDDTGRYDEPVHGSEIALTDGRTVEVKWNDITPNGNRINDLPEGTRVWVSYWKRPIFGDIIGAVKVLG
ncbi:hypothetical protein EMO92_03010 [Bifidobacterium reuteri]|uniref:Uncharacterized protein n=2 Tax=Bifidobacterium reuteri TaxID=983706 RepID=A0A087CT32_9BIFI|nr:MULTISPECIES: hypothetical protein [Bifidobacterium]KAA8826148.1 hypothetical protein EMO92_03010 [Bifidobacterium reuteri]KFI86432.1 hypothetical protein BREU_1614 [Bifidobacterium reuteri DSM 23975]TPF78655.1 hypothetical protein BW09_02780 [Bifidobacterium sp. UTCIF-1]TPF80538.1 hypothetical protein BW08_03700 [Bifidobacterium sp. UTCIF-24]TPF82365.1 hypothetical protein BW12_05430 [Bifidobacterium sp. UTCIF-3]